MQYIYYLSLTNILEHRLERSFGNFIILIRKFN